MRRPVAPVLGGTRVGADRRRPVSRGSPKCGRQRLDHGVAPVRSPSSPRRAGVRRRRRHSRRRPGRPRTWRASTPSSCCGSISLNTAATSACAVVRTMSTMLSTSSGRASHHSWCPTTAYTSPRPSDGVRHQLRRRQHPRQHRQPGERVGVQQRAADRGVVDAELEQPGGQLVRARTGPPERPGVGGQTGVQAVRDALVERLAPGVEQFGDEHRRRVRRRVDVVGRAEQLVGGMVVDHQHLAARLGERPQRTEPVRGWGCRPSPPGRCRGASRRARPADARRAATAATPEGPTARRSRPRRACPTCSRTSASASPAPMVSASGIDVAHHADGVRRVEQLRSSPLVDAHRRPSYLSLRVDRGHRCPQGRAVVSSSGSPPDSSAPVTRYGSRRLPAWHPAESAPDRRRPAAPGPAGPPCRAPCPATCRARTSASG